MPKVSLCTFSDESMSRAADLCMASAKAHGADYVNYWPWDAPSSYSRRAGTGIKQTTFYKQNESLLSQPRGLGFWAWKPYIIGKNMKSLSDGDILIYSDAGVEFINNVTYIIDRMDQDVFLFGNNWEHAHWCKADSVRSVWPYAAIIKAVAIGGHMITNPAPECVGIDWTRFAKQVQASVIFFRVSDYSRAFVAEWLKWCLHKVRYSEGVCTDEWRYLIDDSPSILPNHPEFQEHRHDQAILTTLAYREGLRLHYWPAVYNKGGSPEFVYEKLPEYAGDDYPVLFHHHRRRNHEWKS